MRRASGFTLLELAIGFGILALLGVTFLQVMRGSSQRLAFNANTFAAIHISSKVMADLVEESRVNGTFLQTLESDPDTTRRDDVVEGRSFYFRFLHDRFPPFGRLDPVPDGGITRSLKSSYENLDQYKVVVEPARLGNPDKPGFQRHLAETMVLVDWKESGGLERQYSITARIPSPVGPRPVEDVRLIDEGLLPGRIVAVLFPGRAGSIVQAAAVAGADPGMASNVGRVLVVTNDLQAALSSLSREVAERKKLFKSLLKAPSPELVDTAISIARNHETAASLIYQVLSALGPALKEIREGADPRTLQGIPLVPFRDALRNVQSLAAEFSNRVGQAGSQFDFLLQDGMLPFISARERDYACMKALEALRLQVALETLPGSTLQDFAFREKERQAGRNPFLERFFKREIGFGDKPLKTRFPQLAATVATIDSGIRPFVDDLPRLLAAHPEDDGQ